MTTQPLVRTCPVCGTQFQRITHGKYCTPKCTKLAGRVKSKPTHLKEGDTRKYVILKCEKCTEPFTSINPDAKQCSVCKIIPEGGTKPVAFKKPRALACENCTHWVPCAGADLGYQCQIHFFMRCKPYLPTSEPWSPKS